MKFLSISVVLTLALVATHSSAQHCHVYEDNLVSMEDLRNVDISPNNNGAQVIFGKSRHGGKNRIELYDEPFGIKKVEYPRELKNHALVRFNVRKHHIQFPIPDQFASAAHHNPIESMLEHLDVWSRTRDSDLVLAHFTARQFELFEEAMRRKGVPEGEGDWQVVERDLQKVADEDANKIYMTSLELHLQSGSNLKGIDYDTWFKNFHKHDEIRAFFIQLAKDYPQLITFIPSIGKTIESRDIFAIRLTAKEDDGTIREKPQIWWQGLQHAREWAGGSTVQYLSHHFASNYGKNDEITAILHDTEFIIVPIMNVDGYDYS
ncbi:hypothetical protein BGZ65_012547 [Modicella reniformis]|uniref:Peptidase M14 domain-containing protein n=1 Tax=Modicella reniformis TaxID=1440133 RepID=A0A9P6J676_9FUNG|nr:hypothetical protein BGZ65_012547 [Modicella reniformis]